MKVDVVIVGQGLAGSAMAWRLLHSGRTVCLIDSGSDETASRTAAGLITPVTGKRQVMSPDYEQQWQEAKDFYQQIETITGKNFFSEVRMVRFFRNETERTFFAEHRMNEYQGKVDPRYETGFNLTGYQMYPAGRLNTEEYLNATRQYFSDAGSYVTADLNLASDVCLTADGVEFQKQKIEANILIFCQGYHRVKNRWFPKVPDAPVKGDVLRVRIEGYQEDEIQHRGIWLVPLGEHEYLAGSTYNRQDLSTEPSPTAAAEILLLLKQLVNRPIELIEHKAAIRAAMHNRKPVSEFHGEFKQLAVVNGLGAKGALLAPTVSAAFAPLIVEAIESRRSRMGSVEQSVTRMAQNSLRNVIRKGDLVIDATAGNGHDTLFLAEATGNTGRVVAMDIQEQALRNTQQRLAKAGITIAELHQRSHEYLNDLDIPECTVGAVMFNLGYLPGSDRSVLTSKDSTITAVHAASGLLRRGGQMTVAGYRGHTGGDDETQAVIALVSQLNPELFEVRIHEGNAHDRTSPVLIMVTRR